MKSALKAMTLALPEHHNMKTACLAAARQARDNGYDAVLLIDDESSFKPSHGQQLIDVALSDWPVIVLAVQQPGAPARGYARRISNFLVRLESGRKIPEESVCFRLYPVQLFISRSFISSGPEFLTEALVRGVWAGLPVISVPVQRHSAATQTSSANDIEWLKLYMLHAWLLLRSLIPWPHSRIVPRPPLVSQLFELLHPLRFFNNISKEHNSPAQLAAAVWMGIFIGALPIIPFGIATIIYVNHKLHLNKLAGVGASNVCIAPFVPLLCIEAGHFLRYGRFWYEFNRQTLLLEIPQRLWEWLLGALFVGPALGFAGAFVTFYLVRAMRRKANPEIII